ncbi:lymphocyte antigen 6D-like [Petaurus breviceps papuanus]|uniref:lymphocyte antigen 6D-like n=1 Tax=Petaurus breviceps papuanus TaxID=3040969 RepID=UPI0036DD5CFC
MKTLLGIIMLAILCSDCTPEFNMDALSALNNTNITNGTSTTRPETTPLELLRCHVCMGSYQCYAPQDCAPDEKFCMIAETDEGNTYRVIKYCSIMCPFMDKFHGRTAEDWYIACCAQDLCNYKKLANGNRLCASFLVVAMAFMASFLGILRIGL